MKQSILLSISIYLTSFFAFFSPISLILWTIAAVCFIDLITAIGRDFKRHANRDVGFCRKIKIIKSKKLRRTSIKMMLYLIIVMLLFAIPYVCFGVGLYAAQIGGFAILTHELFSIAENMSIITGNNIFNKIVKKTIKKMTEWISSKMEDNKNI